ncbi:bifunctional nuclease family protein [Melittangium boletus]|uniref:bifunctional nuclease family protein n=1 Tax=Melittangium boletus TaxID=83453 RepID=UPI0015D1FCF5|nr:bifunctional nuclease family protein [Melittangium boletus]
MKTPIPAATFLVGPLSVALLALGALLLPGFGPGPAPGDSAPASEACSPKQGASAASCKELVELEVRDVIPLVEAKTHAVVLSTQDGQMVLPIFVDESAAVAIAFRLAHLRSPQPLSQDLLGSMVTELGAKVTEVRIDDLRDDIYVGRIFLKQGKRQMTLSARPSDSIAMALDGQARIRVTRKVLDEAGISREEIDSLRGEEGPGVGGGGDAGMGKPRFHAPSPHEDVPPTGLGPKLTPERTGEIRL